MSLKVMTWVFDHSEATGSDRLVLLALADHADDETWTCYPGIKRLAVKARVSESTVRRSLKSLETKGHISIITNGGPAYREDRKTNLYEIRKTNGVSNCNDLSNSANDLSNISYGVSNISYGVSNISDGVSNISDGVSTVTPEPSFLKPSSIEPSEEPRSSFVDAEIVDPHQVECERLCNVLADHVANNGYTRPKVTQGWVNDMDLLIRRDGKQPQDVADVIEWAEGHHFWHMNIRSPRSLRKYFERLVDEVRTENRRNPRQQTLTNFHAAYQKMKRSS